jgi:hypothetical protein
MKNNNIKLYFLYYLLFKNNIKKMISKSFFEIFTLFYPLEKKKLLDFIETYDSLNRQLDNNESNYNPTMYLFITELYNHSLNNRYKDNYSYDIIRNRRRIRGIFMDNAASLSKYDILNTNILKNGFLSMKKRKEYIMTFCKTQRTYFAFCRLARLFKLRKFKKLTTTTTDLCLNPLNTLSPSILFNLYDDATRTNYTFRISDMINIIINSLSHSPNFFADPQYIKNPYTNIPFTLAQLYNLYFSIKYSSYLMPTLFHLFFLTDFKLEDFSMKNESFIREEAIKHFYTNMTRENKLYYINQMIIYHMSDMPNIVIDPKFSEEELIKTFSSYLKDYLVASYSLQREQQIEAYTRIQDRLFTFSLHNPTYGRLNTLQVRKQKKIFMPPSIVPLSALTFKFSLSPPSCNIFNSK